MSQDKEENSVLLWEKDKVIPLFTSLKLAPGSAEYAQHINVSSSSYSDDYNPSGIPLYQPSYPSSQKTLRCSHCNTTFENREEQVEHYRTDWHRFNLKRSLESLSSLNFDQFQSGNFDKNNEKESDEENTEEEEEENEFSEEENNSIRKKPRVFFINADQQVISIYRTILHHKNNEASSETDFIHRASAAPRKLYWVIILIGGGHFAGAVYKGPDVIVHKTFHSYTVRSKQGGTQSGRDNKNATSHPRSAGANLRRFNEQSFNQHVQEILEEWMQHITNCDLIFCRCPKKNSQLLYGGQSPLLSRRDEKIRTIPFPTKKPSYLETKRVHKYLAEIIIHEKIKHLAEMEKEKDCNKKTFYRAFTNKEEEKSSFKKLTKGDIADIETRLSPTPDSSADGDSDVIELTTSIETLSSRDLNPYFNSMAKQIKLNKKKRQKKKNKQMDNYSSAEKNEDKEVDNDSSAENIEDKDMEEHLLSNKKRRSLENFLYSSCRTGDISNLKEFMNFCECKDYTCVPDAIPRDVIDLILEKKENWDWKNMKFGANEKTLLHIASENGHKELIWWLLEMGCDPCLKNKRKETPFIATKVKESKNHFRRFMAAYPDKYDYKKADITSPLTKEQELAQKAKQVAKKVQQKKSKEEKLEKGKREQERFQKEKEEKENFLKLSDREKRALAAERRILEKQQSFSVPRCFQCAADISSITPFEYCDFKFCSTKCVKEHRLKSKPL